MDPAIYAFYERLNQNPDDAEAIAVLWDYHGSRLEFQQLATLVEQTAGRRTDPRSAADLFYRAGELWAKNVGRVDKAVGNYKRAFELDPSQLAALESARVIYQQLGNVRLAAQLLDRQLGVTADPIVRSMLLREGAGMRAQLNDLAGQIAYLTEILRTTPDDWEVLRELAGAYLSRSASSSAEASDAQSAAQILASLAQSMGIDHGLPFAEASLDAWAGEETAYAIIHNAYLQTGRSEELVARQIAFLSANPSSPLGGDIRRNLANLYISVGQVEDAIACLEPIADDPEVARPLAALYRQAGRLQELAALLPTLAESADAGQRMQDLRDLAEIHGQTGNRAAMLGAMRDLLHLDPADPEALALIEDDLRARGSYEELRNILWDAVRAEHCPIEARMPKLREIGQLSAQRLNDRDTAIGAWRELLSYDPSDAEGLSALEQLLEASERWDELAQLLEHRAGSEPEPATRRDVLKRLADLQRDKRNDPDGELQALLSLWEIDPKDDVIAERLVNARRAAGDGAGAAEVVRTRAENASEEAAPELWASLAALLTEIGDTNAAIEAWQQVVARSPEYPDGWASLEGLLDASGQHAILFETLIQRAGAMPEGVERSLLHARAAMAAQSMGDVSAAIAEAERAMAMAPGEESNAHALMDLLEINGERDRLLEFSRSRAAAMEDGPARIELYRRTAHAVGQVDPHGAAVVWQELRECARRAGLTDDAEAIDALVGLAEVAEDHPKLVALFDEAAAFTQEVSIRKDFLRRRAEIQKEALNDADGAIATLERLAREVDPADATSWALLGEAAQTAERWPLAAESLEMQITLAEDDELKSELGGLLVTLSEKEIGTPDAILHALEVHAAADPGDLGVVSRLAEMTEKEGRYADAVRHLETLAETEGDDEELSKITQHIATLAEEKLKDPKKAWDVLLPLVQGGDIASLEHIMELASRQGMHVEVTPILVDLASRVSDDEARANLWFDVGERRSKHLNDRPGAFEAYVAAFIARPTETAWLTQIDALAPEAMQADLLASAYRAAVEACSDPTAAHDLASRGITLLEASGARTVAFELSLQALNRAPADDDLLEAVVRLAEGQSRNDDVYLAFDKRKRATQSDVERLAVTLRAAAVAGGVLGDRETAFQYIEQAVGQAIGRKEPDEDALARTEAAAREADEHRPESGMVSGVVERYAQLAEDAAEDNPRVAAVLLRRAGVLCDADLGLMDHALALYSRAVSLWPSDLRGAEALEDAATRARKVADVVVLYQRVIDDAYEVAVARTYTSRRAALLAERLNRTDEAIEALGRLVELAPKDVEALHALQALLERHARWQPLLIALERELELGLDRASVLRRIATLWETQLRNVFEARDAWKKVLRVVPDDAEALEALQRLDRKPKVDVDLDLEDALEDDGRTTPPPASMEQALSDAELDAALDAETLSTGENAALDALAPEALAHEPVEAEPEAAVPHAPPSDHPSEYSNQDTANWPEAGGVSDPWGQATAVPSGDDLFAAEQPPESSEATVALDLPEGVGPGGYDLHGHWAPAPDPHASAGHAHEGHSHEAHAANGHYAHADEELLDDAEAVEAVDDDMLESVDEIHEPEPVEDDAPSLDDLSALDDLAALGAMVQQPGASRGHAPPPQPPQPASFTATRTSAPPPLPPPQFKKRD